MRKEEIIGNGEGEGEATKVLLEGREKEGQREINHFMQIRKKEGGRKGEDTKLAIITPSKVRKRKKGACD